MKVYSKKPPQNIQDILLSLSFMLVIVVSCPEDNMDTPYGNYTWPGSTRAETEVEFHCQYSCGDFSEGTASRMCNRKGEWNEVNFSECPTFRFCKLLAIQNVRCTACTVYKCCYVC